jgi:inhibitor of KinA
VSDFRIVPAGDAALTVEFDDRIDPAVNAQAIALAGAVRAAAVTGVRDVVPTYRSVTVYFDRLKTDYDNLVSRLETDARRRVETATTDRQPVRIPVCYGGEFGPDLSAVAAFGHVAEEEVIRLHASTPYRVFMLGFVPGFAYLGLVDDQIAAPRRRMPRVRVPRGSVGIAGAQTGVYPVETPGGWQLVGRTPVKPFDPSRREPFLMQPGDTVQFYPIDRAEFDRLQPSAQV